MKNLVSLVGKRVRLTDIDRNIWMGKVDLFDYADENDNREDSIAILCDDKLIEFYESEIKNAEII